MKIHTEIDPTITQPEITIRCREVNDEILQLQSAIASTLKANSRLALYQNDKEYFIPPEQILFFESVDGKTFAHAAKSVFETKLKLYELENILPSTFTRSGKSVIVGTRFVLSITRNLAGPSLVRFRGSHKQVNVSRSYYRQLINKLNERSLQ